MRLRSLTSSRCDVEKDEVWVAEKDGRRKAGGRQKGLTTAVDCRVCPSILHGGDIVE